MRWLVVYIESNRLRGPSDSVWAQFRNENLLILRVMLVLITAFGNINVI